MRVLWALPVLLVALTSSPVAAAPPDWEVDETTSQIGVTFTQLGSPIDAVFSRFQARIAFDPEAAEGLVVVTIDTDSFDSGESDRDKEAHGPAFFDAAAHPSAVFEAAEFQHDGDGFIAAGTLTLKGVKRPAELPFVLTQQDDGVRARGSMTVDRQAFGVGTGDWATNGAIGDAVSISVDVIAKRR